MLNVSIAIRVAFTCARRRARWSNLFGQVGGTTHSLPTKRSHGHEHRGIRPSHTVAERSSPTGERPAERGLDPGAAACRVERLSRRILGQHPEIEAPVGRAVPDQLAGCFGQQPRPIPCRLSWWVTCKLSRSVPKSGSSSRIM